MMEQAFPEHRAAHADRVRERGDLHRSIGDLRWNDADDKRWTAANEHDAVAIVNDAARSGDLNQAHLICLRGHAVAFTVDELHLHESADQCADRERDDEDEPRDSPWRTLPFATRTAPAFRRGHVRFSKRRTMSTKTAIAIALSTI